MFFFSVFISIFKSIRSNRRKKYNSIISSYTLFFLIIFSLSLTHFILSSVSLSLNIKYVNNFLNKINKTFVDNKLDFIPDIMILVHDIMIFLITSITCCFENINRNCKIKCPKCKPCDCYCRFFDCLIIKINYLISKLNNY